MFQKKIMILAILLVGILMFSAVSAADNATCDVASADETPDDNLDDDLEIALCENSDDCLNLTSDTSADDILTSNPDTFTNLDAKINGNNDTVINLDCDYIFNDYDIALKYGIKITRDLTLNGNGHTIDADHKNAKIFNVTGCTVTFKNIKFANAGPMQNYGLAIRFEGSNATISNCSFENCTGHAGGAIRYNGGQFVFTDCYFKNNIATGDYGGALYLNNCVGTISNCIFIGNEAKTVGGGLYWCGKPGTVSNCYFENNKANKGGAISLSHCDYDVINCSFANNTANQYGGAIDCQKDSPFALMILYSNFTDNTAPNGGAMGYGHALFCTFAGNHADQTGGALYNSKYSICNFNNNTAGQDGNDTYGSTLLKLSTQIYSPAVTAVYNAGKYLKITLKDSYGHLLSDANVSVDFNGIINCTTDKNGQVKLSTKGIVPDVYNVTISYAGDGDYIQSTNTTKVTLNKGSYKITAQSFITFYNIDKYLVITLKDGNGDPLNGKFNVVLNGKKYNPTAKNGQAKILISGLIPKVYYAKVTFPENSCYLRSTKDVKVTVSKANPRMTASFKVYKLQDKTKKYVVVLKDNKNRVLKNSKVTIRLNTVTYTAKTNSKGQAIFKFTKLAKKGQFIATVKYAGNAYYKTLNKKYVITVK